MIAETKIMQLADGTLPQEEHEEVKKAIEADPKLKELFNTYQETGDLLFKLGNEIKSQPLPQNLQKKAEILKGWKKKTKQKSVSFNFFRLFKMQYAVITAVFCLFFVGGFYIDEIGKLDNKWNPKIEKIAKIDKENLEEKKWILKKKEKKIKEDKLLVQKKKKRVEIIAAPDDEHVNKFYVYEKSIIEKNIKRIVSEELQLIFLNEYFYYGDKTIVDEKSFSNEISQFIDQLGINDKFETSLLDKNHEKIKFILVESFYEGRCKRIIPFKRIFPKPDHDRLFFEGKLIIDSLDLFEIDSLDLCKINGNYKLLSLNIVETVSTSANK